MRDWPLQRHGTWLDPIVSVTRRASDTAASTCQGQSPAKSEIHLIAHAAALHVSGLPVVLAGDYNAVPASFNHYPDAPPQSLDTISQHTIDPDLDQSGSALPGVTGQGVKPLQ